MVRGAFQAVSDPDFLLRIPAGEFARHPGVPNPLFSKIFKDVVKFPFFQGGDFDTPVVHVSRNVISVLKFRQLPGGKARTGGNHHADAVDFPLHDGVGRKGRTDGQPFDPGKILSFQQVVGGVQERRHQMVLPGEKLDFFGKPSVPDQDGIRVGSSHVDSDNHCPTSPYPGYPDRWPCKRVRFCLSEGRLSRLSGGHSEELPATKNLFEEGHPASLGVTT